MKSIKVWFLSFFLLAGCNYLNDDPLFSNSQLVGKLASLPSIEFEQSSGDVLVSIDIYSLNIDVGITLELGAGVLEFAPAFYGGTTINFRGPLLKYLADITSNPKGLPDGRPLPVVGRLSRVSGKHASIDSEIFFYWGTGYLGFFFPLASKVKIGIGPQGIKSNNSANAPIIGYFSLIAAREDYHQAGILIIIDLVNRFEPAETAIAPLREKTTYYLPGVRN